MKFMLELVMWMGLLGIGGIVAVYWWRGWE
jgi:hypothetical protein